jgi:SPP1 gp7 family putative phage head morphogenesis protein
MTKRRTLAEAFASTKAVAPARAAAAKRADRAAVAKMAPTPADADVTAYEGAANKAAERMARLLDTGVAGAELEQGLLDIVRPLARNAAAAAKRISAQGKREVGRMLQVKMPAADERERVLLQLFTDRNMAYYRKVVADVVADPLRNQLWRIPLVARAESWKLQGAVVEHWAVSAGSGAYVWHTRHDPRVRDGHAHLDGKTFSWSSPPNTGRREGNNHPGQAVACRCVAVPVEAFEVA